MKANNSEIPWNEILNKIEALYGTTSDVQKPYTWYNQPVVCRARKVLKFSDIKDQIKSNINTTNYVYLDEDDEEYPDHFSITFNGVTKQFDTYVDEQGYLKFDYILGSFGESNSYAPMKISCYFYTTANEMKTIIENPNNTSLKLYLTTYIDENGYLKNINNCFVVLYNGNYANFTLNDCISKPDDNHLYLHNSTNLYDVDNTRTLIKPKKAKLKCIYSKVPYMSGNAPYSQQLISQNGVNCATLVGSVLKNLKYQNSRLGNNQSNSLGVGAYFLENADKKPFFKKAFRSGLDTILDTGIDGSWYTAHDLAHYAAAHGWYKNTANPSECEIGDVIFFSSTVYGPNYIYPQTSLEELKTTFTNTLDNEGNKIYNIEKYSAQWRNITHCGIVIGKIGGGILVAESSRDASQADKGLQKYQTPERKTYYSYPINKFAECIQKRYGSQYWLIDQTQNLTQQRYYDFASRSISIGENGLKRYPESIEINNNIYKFKKIGDSTGYPFYPGLSAKCLKIGNSFPKPGINKKFLNKFNLKLKRNEKILKTKNGEEIYEELYANDGVATEFLSSNNDSLHTYEKNISYITDSNGKKLGISKCTFRMEGFGRFPLNNLPCKKPYQTQHLNDIKQSYDAFNNDHWNGFNHNESFYLLHQGEDQTTFRTFLIRNPYFDGTGYSEQTGFATGWPSLTIPQQYETDENGVEIYTIENNGQQKIDYKSYPFLKLQIDYEYRLNFSGKTKKTKGENVQALTWNSIDPYIERQLQFFCNIGGSNDLQASYNDTKRNAKIPTRLYVYYPVQFTTINNGTDQQKDIITKVAKIYFVTNEYLNYKNLTTDKKYYQNSDYVLDACNLSDGTYDQIPDEFKRVYFTGGIPNTTLYNITSISKDIKYGILNSEGHTQTKESSRLGLYAKVNVPYNINPFIRGWFSLNCYTYFLRESV